MENTFTVRNFRIFDEKGASFKFKPITLLTGQNGSGKSSLTKAIILLADYMQQILLGEDKAGNRIINLLSGELNLGGLNLTLGDYNSVVNSSSFNKIILFEYSCDCSLAPGHHFIGKYYFKPSEEYNGNGRLDKLELFCDNELFLRVNVDPTDLGCAVDFFNIDLLLDSFKVFFVSSNVQYLKDRILKLGYSMPDGTHDDIDNQLTAILGLFNDKIKQLGWEQGFNCDTYSEDNYGFIQKTHFGETAILRSTLFDSFELLEKKNILFYFPVLEKTKGLGKEGTCELLRTVSGKVPMENLRNKKDGYLGHLPYKDYISAKVLAEDFFRSPFDEFIDYYQFLEKKFRQDIFYNRYGKYTLGLSRYNESLLEQIKKDAAVSFDSVATPKSATSLRREKDDAEIDFLKVYGFLSNWEWDARNNKEVSDDTIIERARMVADEYGVDDYSSSHYIYTAYLEFLGYVIQDVMIPRTFDSVNYLGNFHISLRRVFSLELDDLFTGRVAHFLQAKNRLKHIPFKGWKDVLGKDYKAGDFIDHWLQKLKLGHSLHVSVGEDGRSVSLSVLRDETDTVGVPIADQGYGVFQIIAILLSIETGLMDLVSDYFSESFFYKNTPVSTIILEEPEANLHPAYQSIIANILYSAINYFDKLQLHFIVETHSEYLIRASQVIVAQTTETEEDLEKNPFIVYYIDRGGEAYDMEYQVSGRFNKPFGTGFFDEAGKSSLEIIRKERRMADGKDA